MTACFKQMEWIFLTSLLLLVGHIVWYSWRYGITPTPTGPKVKKALLELLPTSLHGNIMELGSGWGTLAFALAQQAPMCHVWAYEISPIPYFVSLCLQKWKRVPHLHFIRQDFFQVSLQDASLIICYLYPGAMQRLKVKFEQELAPGTYVLSHTFAVPGWTPLHCIKADDLYQTPIYLYQIGE